MITLHLTNAAQTVRHRIASPFVPRVGEVIILATVGIGDEAGDYAWRVDHVVYETAARGSAAYREIRADLMATGPYTSSPPNAVYTVTLVCSPTPNPYRVAE